MKSTTSHQSKSLARLRRTALRALLTALLAFLAITSASYAQFEKTVLIDGSSWMDFYKESSTSLPFANDFRTYNIAFEKAFQVGAPSNNQYIYQLSGVQIRSKCEDSWVAGPFNFAELVAYVQTSQARMIDIEKVAELGLVGNGPFYFVVMTSNKGTQAKGWHWLVGVSFDEIRQFEDEHNVRVIDLEIVDAGSYAAIFISNTGDDERETIYGIETTQEDIELLADWGSDDYRLVHIGYEGNSAGDGGIYWNYIFERTDEIASARPVFDVTPAQLTSIALEGDERISMIDFNRFTDLHAAILVEQLP